MAHAYFGRSISSWIFDRVFARVGSGPIYLYDFLIFKNDQARNFCQFGNNGADLVFLSYTARDRSEAVCPPIQKTFSVPRGSGCQENSKFNL